MSHLDPTTAIIVPWPELSLDDVGFSSSGGFVKPTLYLASYGNEAEARSRRNPQSTSMHVKSVGVAKHHRQLSRHVLLKTNIP